MPRAGHVEIEIADRIANDEHLGLTKAVDGEGEIEGHGHFSRLRESITPTSLDWQRTIPLRA
jgi:hypothetical protein